MTLARIRTRTHARLPDHATQRDVVDMMDAIKRALSEAYPVDALRTEVDVTTRQHDSDTIVTIVVDTRLRESAVLNLVESIVGTHVESVNARRES